MAVDWKNTQFQDDNVDGSASSTVVTPPDANYNKSFKYGFYMLTGTSDDIPYDTNFYHELVLNPQSIVVREPAATSIKPTQGGGLLIEKRGGLMKHISISGTTGWVPPASSKAGGAPRAVTIKTRNDEGPQQPTAAEQTARAARSGFHNFHVLKNLFRTYMDICRRGQQAYLVYMNYKDDEFWMCEIDDFVWSRDRRAGQTYTYAYRITLTGWQMLLAKDHHQQTEMPEDVFVTDADTKAEQALARVTILADEAQQLARQTVGRVGVYLEIAASSMNDVITQADAYANLGASVATAVLGAFDRALFNINGALDVFNDLTSDRLKRGVSEWATESKQLLYLTRDHYRQSIEDRPGLDLFHENSKYTDTAGFLGSASGAVQGSSTDAITNASTFGGQAGLQGVVPLQQIIDTKVYRQEPILSGETVWDLSLRLFGNVQAFVILVKLNKLEAPYIVSDRVSKPPNTLAWGEYISAPDIFTKTTQPVSAKPQASNPLAYTSVVDSGADASHLEDTTQSWVPRSLIGYTVTMTSGVALGDPTRVVVDNDATTLTLNRPWTALPVVGDAYNIKMVSFTLRRALTPDELAYGTDLLLTWSGSGSDRRADLTLDAKKDLALVRGRENYEQALDLMSRITPGSLVLHPQAGFAVPPGRRMTSADLMFYSYTLRLSLLRDWRTARVLRPSLVTDGDKAYLQADVQPFRATKTSRFRQPIAR